MFQVMLAGMIHDTDTGVGGGPSRAVGFPAGGASSPRGPQVEASSATPTKSAYSSSEKKPST